MTTELPRAVGAPLDAPVRPDVPKREVLLTVVDWALAGHISERGVTCEAGDAIRAAVSAELKAEREQLLDRVRQALLDTSEEGDGDYADSLFERILQGMWPNV